MVRVHRGKPSRLATTFVAAVALGLLGAPGALAATVIGEQNLVPNMGSADQLGQNIPVFQGDAGAGYVLSAPQVGTITSWKFLSGGVATGTHFELAVLAPTDNTGMGWRLLATSAPVAVSTATGVDAVNGPFPAQIAIDAGERIALMPVDGSNTPIETGAQGVDGIRYFSAPFGSLGSSQQVASTADNGQVVPIQATIGTGGSAPMNTRLPSISGTARQFETLRADDGLWQNGVTKFSYAWLRCAPDGSSCAAISGADANNYTLTVEDIGFTVRFQVIASNAGGDSQPALSAPTAVVQRGVLTARFTISPIRTCAGVSTVFDASGSASPDGIKSYTWRFEDLYSMADEALFFAGTPITTEDAADQGESDILTFGKVGGQDVLYWVNHSEGRAAEVVTDRPAIAKTFDWNRSALPPFDPSVLVRDPLVVVLDVHDYAGGSAQTLQFLTVEQFRSTDSRAKCPKTALNFKALPGGLVTKIVHFTSGSSQPSTTATCRTRVACVGSITVARQSCSACATDAVHSRSLVLASGFFNVRPHRTRNIPLTLTKLGKRQLHRGVRVRVRVTVTSVGPTGRSVKHAYSEVLSR